MPKKIKHELEKILEFSQDMICIIDAEGVFLRVSSASTNLLGYAPYEMIGKSYRRFIHPDYINAGNDAIREVVYGSGMCQLENCYQHKAGHFIPLVWSGSWDAEENVIHCIARDDSIRQQKRELMRSLEESNLRYKYVTNATSDAIWDWNLVTGGLYWGEGYKEIFGHSHCGQNDDNSSWIKHIHPDDIERITRSIYQVIEGQETNWKDEYRYERSDGTYAEVVDRGFVIRTADGIAIRMVGAMHDITERKASMRELKQLADDLFARNRELHHFGYIISHNLRSPVANIMGLANLQELSYDDPEVIRHCTSNLKSSIIRLDEVIQDLSKILSLDDGSIELSREQVDMTDVITKVISGLNEQIRATKACIRITGDKVIIESYKAYVYSIFFNLISNALKYRSDKSPVIDVSVRQSPTAILIEIADNGIGIDLDKHKDDLFKPYMRFNHQKEGKGLGLFLVQSHIKALNGQINLSSSLTNGTIFKITLPNI